MLKKYLLVLIGIILGSVFAYPLVADALSVYMPVQGGTGTGVIPTFGQLLVGTNTGVYTPTTTIPSATFTSLTTTNLGLLSAATSTAGNCLQSDANGTITNAPCPSASAIQFYFYSTSSSIAGYKTMTQPEQSGSVNYVTSTSVTNNQLLMSWITPTSSPNLTFIPSGQHVIHIHAYQSAGTKTSQLYAQIYKRDVSGTETLLGTTPVGSILTSVEADNSLSTNLNATSTLATDRLVVKIYASVSGGGSAPDVVIGFSDATGAGYRLPSSGATNLVFVPYTGATQNLDMGVYGVSSTALTSTYALFTGVTTTNLNVSSQLTTPLTVGSVAFAGTNGILSQDNANFFYNSATHKLGLGTTTPGYQVDSWGNFAGGFTNERITNASTNANAYGTINLQNDIGASGGSSAGIYMNSSQRVSDGASSTLGVYNDLADVRFRAKGNIPFYTNNTTNVMTASSSGYVWSRALTVGLGTGAPGTQRLRLDQTDGASAASVIEFSNGTNSMFWFLEGVSTGSRGQIRTDSTRPIVLQDNATSGLGPVNIGSASASGYKLWVEGAGASSGTWGTMRVRTGAGSTGQTASTEVNNVWFDLNATRTWATGSITNQREVLFDAPTYAFNGASTITNASTVAISGAPVAGTNATITNSASLWVQAGTTRLDGNVGISSSSPKEGFSVATTTYLGAGLVQNYTFTTAATYAVKVTDLFIAVSSTANYSSTTLPSAASVRAGTTFKIKDVNPNDTSIVRVLPTASDKIDTVASTTPFDLPQGGSAEFISDGISNWNVN